VFSPLNHPESVVDRCTDALRNAILTGVLAVGSKLPPERSLAEQFDVHRGTVRAALDRLTEDGLLDVRQGRGYRVKDYRRSGGPDLLKSMATIAAERGALLPLITDLLVVRRLLAVAVLDRIRERQEKLPAVEWAELRADIVAAVDVFGEAVAEGADLETLAQADVAVVAALVAAAGSSVFSLCMNPLADTLFHIPSLRAAIYRDPETNLTGWRILEAWIDMPKLAPVDVILEQLRLRDEVVVDLLGDSA
jgi:GntR family transcriptional repressor for pyruvate dehydrogenase complex